MNDPEFFVYFTSGSGHQDQPALISSRSNYGFACTVPAGAISGKIKIVSGTGAAAVEKVSLFDFIVVVPLQLTGLSPRSGPHGATVRITGSSFRSKVVDSVCFWNGTAVAACAIPIGGGDDYIDVLVPDGAQGTGTVEVHCLGTGYVLVRDTPVAFTVTPLPTPTSSPTATATCPPGQVLCAGGCKDLNVDVNNCGSCGNVCAVANGIPGCVNGHCVIVSCIGGFGDCNGNVSDGCETNLNIDQNNCGTCRHVCPPGQTCKGGVCSL
jgi:hypothetical protein